MRKLLINMLTEIARRFPWEIKMALLRGICQESGAFDNAFNILSRLACVCNVSFFRSAGLYGRIESSSTDLSIFASYARTGVWAEEINGNLVEFFRGRSGTYIDVGAHI